MYVDLGHGLKRNVFYVKIHVSEQGFSNLVFAASQSQATLENPCQLKRLLTHWGRVTHICVSKLTTIGSDNGLSPDRRQAIIWTNAGILLIGPIGTNFSENLIEILTFSFNKMRLKVSSAKRWPFCLGLNVLMCAASQSGSIFFNHL